GGRRKFRCRSVSQASFMPGLYARRAAQPTPYPPGAGPSLADVGHQRHEAGPLDGVLDRPLEGGAGAGALAAHPLALVVAQLLQGHHVLVIDGRGPRAALLGAEAAAVLPVAAEFLADHPSPPRAAGQIVKLR